MEIRPATRTGVKPLQAEPVFVDDEGGTALIKSAPLEMTIAESPMQLLSMAVQRGADVGTLERLADLAERFDKKKAKSEFDTAMAAFQADCPVILKTVNGAQKAYRYAPLDHIVTQVKELLKQHGFSFTLSSVCGKDTVKAIIFVKHRGGHFESSEFEVPVDTKNPMMTAPQRFGGALTFAKRYALCNAFGILTADEDNDAQGPKTKRGLADINAERAAAKRETTETAAAAKEATSAPTEKSERRRLEEKLWKELAPVRGNDKPTSWTVAEAWMQAKKILPPSLTVREASEFDLKECIAKTQIELNPE